MGVGKMGVGEMAPNQRLEGSNGKGNKEVSR